MRRFGIFIHLCFYVSVLTIFISSAQCLPLKCNLNQQAVKFIYLEEPLYFASVKTLSLYPGWMLSKVIESHSQVYGLLVENKMVLFMQSYCATGHVSCSTHDTEVE